MPENENDSEIHIVEEADGYFKINIVSKVVYLEVLPPRNGGRPVTETMVINYLKARMVNNYNQEQIALAVNEAASSSVAIAELGDSENQEEMNIQVNVSDDQLKAWLAIRPEAAETMTLELLLKKLKERGILYGLLKENIKAALEDPGQRMLCAQGLAGENGKNGEVKVLVDLERKGKPKELEDGRVDYKDIGAYIVVAENDVLAERIPPTLGVPGMDIFGQKIPRRAGHDVQLPAGRNTAVKENKLTATQAGQVVIENDKLAIVPIIDIAGDVDFSTGNINFNGNVIIKGTVNNGFSVHSTGDVTVHGAVNGTVEARNIFINMGIQGMDHGTVVASGDLTAKFIENANVQAGRDIKVNGVILNSNVRAGRIITVEGRKGLISGGITIAGEEIRVRNIGTQLSMPTNLQVGVNPLMREEHHRLTFDIKEGEVNLAQTQKALTILNSMKQEDLSAEKREMLLKVTKRQFTLTAQLETMRHRLGEIELSLDSMRYGKIKVSDYVYPGTHIAIGTLTYLVREVCRFVVFYSEKGEIKTMPYK